MTIKIGTKFDDGLIGTGAGDVLLGLDGADRLSGLIGDDLLSGGRGNDNLLGASGADTVLGGLGADTISGGDGDDILSGGGSLATLAQNANAADSDADRLNGGTGNDRVMIGLKDTADGGQGGYDTLIVTRLYDPNDVSPLTLDFSKVAGATATAFGLGTARAAQFERVEVSFAGPAGSKITGTGGDDLIATPGISARQTGPNDFVFGATLIGGAGDDLLKGSTNKDDKIYGGTGDDEINSGLGIDIVSGGSGADLFIIDRIPLDPLGGGGTTPDTITDFDPKHDVLLLNLRSLDALTAPTDKITLVSNGNPVASSATNGQFLYNTNSGKLSFDGNGMIAGGIVDIAILKNKPVLTAANLVADGFLTIPVGEAATANNLSAAQARAGTSGANVMKGGTSTDKLFGNLGNDKLTGLGGDDLLFGGYGADTVDGGEGNDRIVGGCGADKILGGGGNDFIIAGVDARSSPNEFNDGLRDTVDGGAGNDRILIDRGDTALGGCGTDTLLIEYRTYDQAEAPLVKLDFAQVTGNTAGAFGFGQTTAGQFERVDIRLVAVKAGSSLSGTAGDDSLALGIRPESSGPLAGSGKGGSVYGRTGDDRILDSSFIDTLNGGSGNDTIHTFGGDTIILGQGADQVVTTIGGGEPTIKDFTGDDAIVVAYRLSEGTPFTFDTETLVVGIAQQGSNPGLAQFLYNPLTGSLRLDTNGSIANGVETIAQLDGGPGLTAHQLAVEFFLT
ncbi:hypothetical protein BH10PSE7_BH10PSE7_03370 [soil metagenome]